MLGDIVQRHNRLELSIQRESLDHLVDVEPLSRTDYRTRYVPRAESSQQVGDTGPKLKLRNDQFVEDQHSLSVEPLGARETVPFNQALRDIDQRYAYKFGFRIRSELDAKAFEHPTLRLEVQRLRIHQQAVNVEACCFEFTQG